MAMPGFTAEAALCPTAGRYRMSGAFAPTAGEVQPQGILVIIGIGVVLIIGTAILTSDSPPAPTTPTAPAGSRCVDLDSCGSSPACSGKNVGALCRGASGRKCTAFRCQGTNCCCGCS